MGVSAILFKISKTPVTLFVVLGRKTFSVSIGLLPKGNVTCFSPRVLPLDDDDDLDRLLSTALSSPELRRSIMPAFQAATASLFSPNASRDERAEIVTTVIGKALASGLPSVLASQFPDVSNDVAPAAVEARALPMDESTRLSLLPEKGSVPTWADRTKFAELAGLNPVEFYRTVWGSVHHLIYQDELNERDPKLGRAIRSFCSRNSTYIALEVLPPPSHVRTDRIAEGIPNTKQQAVYSLKERARSAARRASASGHDGPI